MEGGASLSPRVRHLTLLEGQGIGYTLRVATDASLDHTGHNPLNCLCPHLCDPDLACVTSHALLHRAHHFAECTVLPGDHGLTVCTRSCWQEQSGTLCEMASSVHVQLYKAPDRTNNAKTGLSILKPDEWPAYTPLSSALPTAYSAIWLLQIHFLPPNSSYSLNREPARLTWGCEFYLVAGSLKVRHSNAQLQPPL